MKLKGLLCMIAMASASAGCDSVTTGQLEDDPGPPRLMRIMVQEESPGGSRGLATDLLDDTPVTCSDINPCVVTSSVLGTPPGPCVIPDGETEGVCPDLFAAGPVLIGTPVAAGGIQIRLVFSKILDPKIETITKDATGATMHMLVDDGVVDLQDESGHSIDSIKYWDPTGAPLDTSFEQYVPFGPALVIKPTAPLSVSSVYKVVLTQAKALDKKDQGAVDKTGSAFATDPYVKELTTEDLMILMSTIDQTTDMTTMMPVDATIAPNDPIQLTFNADVAALSVVIMRGSTPVLATTMADLGADPTMCAPNNRLWDIQPASGVFAEGDYTMVITKAVAADSTMSHMLTGMSYGFRVMGPANEAATVPINPTDCVTPDGGV